MNSGSRQEKRRDIATRIEKSEEKNSKLYRKDALLIR